MNPNLNQNQNIISGNRPSDNFDTIFSGMATNNVIQSTPAVIQITTSTNIAPPPLYTPDQDVLIWLTKLAYYIKISNITKNKKEC